MLLDRAQFEIIPDDDIVELFAQKMQDTFGYHSWSNTPDFQKYNVRQACLPLLRELGMNGSAWPGNGLSTIRRGSL